jgi:hypothetical protein
LLLCASQYFIATFYRKSTIVQLSVKRTDFANSSMGRDMIQFHGQLKARPKEQFLLVNTHLESTNEFAEARKEQIREALSILEKTAVPAILTGSSHHLLILFHAAPHVVIADRRHQSSWWRSVCTPCVAALGKQS